jgi:hypothetical protein
MVWKSLLCSIESFAQDFQKFIERSRGLESRCRSEANILKALLSRLNSLENDTAQVLSATAIKARVSDLSLPMRFSGLGFTYVQLLEFTCRDLL